MSNLPKMFGGMNLPTQGIPQLKSTGFITRTFHAMKLEDLARIADLEGKIANNNLVKMKANIEAVTMMATFGERMKSEIENVEISLKINRALAREAEARASIAEKGIVAAEAQARGAVNEANEAEFNFHEYMKRVQNET